MLNGHGHVGVGIQNRRAFVAQLLIALAQRVNGVAFALAAGGMVEPAKLYLYPLFVFGILFTRVFVGEKYRVEYFFQLQIQAATHGLHFLHHGIQAQGFP